MGFTVYLLCVLLLSQSPLKQGQSLWGRGRILGAASLVQDRETTRGTRSVWFRNADIDQKLEHLKRAAGLESTPVAGKRVIKSTQATT
jgi:acetoacetate decarboxylase